MAEAELETIVNEAKSNKLLTSLNNLSQDDILSVWGIVSAFIARSMQARKGVSIPNFGTFTFSQLKMDVGIKNDLVVQRPVFVAAERFLQTLGIQQTKVLVCGEIPVQLINYSAISFESSFNRETVETCVHGVMQTLQRSVNAQRNVEFTFNGLGRLYIRNGRLKMKFFKDFVNSLDSSGVVLDAMKNRPSTADSVMSDIQTARAGAISVNTVRLPRGANEDSALKAIREEDEGFISEGGRNSAQVDEETQTVAGSDLTDNAPGLTRRVRVAADATPTEKERNGDEQKGGAETTRTVSSLGKPLHIINMEVPQLTVRATSRSDRDIPEFRRSSNYAGSTSRADNGPDSKLPPIESRLSSAAASASASMANSDRKDASVGTSDETTARKTSRIRCQTAMSCKTDDCHSCHGSAAAGGQELCYVCYQRAKLNVPIYFDEERRRQDRAEDEMMTKYHDMKVAEFLLSKKQQTLAQRHEAQKVAAFNRGAADASRNQKLTKSEEFFPSYIFQQRAKTPHKSVKQEAYNRQLGEQVGIRQRNRDKLKAEEAFLDEIEQQQLATELAEQRARYLQSKAAAKQSYKDALDMQVNTKVETTPPPREPDSTTPVFGKNDARTEDLIAQRQRAIEVAKHQVETVESKKKLELLQKMKEQQDEESVLKRNAEETTFERARRYQELYQTRKALEKEWIREADDKLQREVDEYRATISNPGGLVQEQMDKYKRCAQCKRKLHNTGELNVWTDSRYVTGTRYMM